MSKKTIKHEANGATTTKATESSDAHLIAFRKACKSDLIKPERDKELMELAQCWLDAMTPKPVLKKLAHEIQEYGGRDKAPADTVRRFDELAKVKGANGGCYPIFLNNAEESKRLEFHKMNIISQQLAKAANAERDKKLEAEERVRTMATALRMVSETASDKPGNTAKPTGE